MNSSNVSLINTTHTQNEYQSENNVQDSNDKSRIYEVIGFMTAYSVLCLLGIIGNGLVIWFGIFKMKKTVNVVWFLNLAVADFFFAFFLPLNFTQLLLGYRALDIMCKLIHFLLYINLGVGLSQITVISVDRCICVVFPVWCHNHRRPRLAFILVLIIWIISFAGSMAAIRYSRMAMSNGMMKCLVNTDQYNFMKKIILEFVFVFLLPFIIIVSCYIVIILHIRRKRSLTLSKPLKTSVAVIIAFFICWLPIHLDYFLHFFDSYVHQNFYLAATLLIVVNCCINPILYVFIGRDFKEKFCGSFQAKLEKAFIEEDKAVDEKQERRIALQSLHQDNKEEEVIG